ncbi:hypothetical protein [Bacillus wiedmannii]|uniref:hypothetical protein n=1 Tax=Bacillus wiedmannii TaxID=1890302 RepID=UPI0034C64592
MFDPFKAGDWCDICGDKIESFEMRSMYIEGCEKTLCQKCRNEMDKNVKAVDFYVLQDVMKKLIEMFGRNKVRQFNLTAAEQVVKENDISMKIEKRGGRLHQERLGEFSVFSTAELITVITFLK